jgi:Mn-containing catalase
MLLHTGTEEIGHIEVLATAVAMNLDGLPSEQVDDVVTNPLVSARMGGIEPRHFLSGGLSAMPADANGVRSTPRASTSAATSPPTCERTSRPRRSAGHWRRGCAR